MHPVNQPAEMADGFRWRRSAVDAHHVANLVSRLPASDLWSMLGRNCGMGKGTSGSVTTSISHNVNQLWVAKQATESGRGSDEEGKGDLCSN